MEAKEKEKHGNELSFLRCATASSERERDEEKCSRAKFFSNSIRRQNEDEEEEEKEEKMSETHRVLSSSFYLGNEKKMQSDSLFRCNFIDNSPIDEQTKEHQYIRSIRRSGTKMFV